jgi:hypothetical protein
MCAPRVFHVWVLMLLVAPPMAPASQWATSALPDRDYVVMSRFLTAVDAYVVEHHRLFEPLSEEMMCLPDDTLEKMNALAHVPREARPMPREGEIFTPDVAELFTRLIPGALAGGEHDTGDLIASIVRESLCAPPVRVNAPPPRGMGRTLIPSPANGLPLLPDELEYRLVGRDLVLLDVPSNLVVDVIRAALPMF